MDTILMEGESLFSWKNKIYSILSSGELGVKVNKETDQLTIFWNISFLFCFQKIGFDISLACE